MIRINKKGFTFVEAIVAITLVGIVFLPLMRLFTVAIDSINETKVQTTAVSLAREYMEKVKNLNLTEKGYKRLNEVDYFPPLKKEPFEINNERWRIKRVIHKNTDPLRIDFYVYIEGKKEPIYSLSTLIEDL